MYINSERIIEKVANKDIDVVYNTAIEFFKNKFSISGAIKVKNVRRSGYSGYIDILKILDNRLELLIDKSASLSAGIGYLVHELTHISQVLKKKLDISSDHKTFLWDGKPYITVKEYGKLKIQDYELVPWEKEAYFNGKNLPSVFFQSKEFKDLAKINDTLKFIVDNQ